jgi:short-subunit dehydrogenase
MEIQDKVIIVTGASMGIGESTARLLAKHGAKIVLAARSKDALEKLSEELPGSLVVPTDMTKKSDIEHLVKKTLDEFGRIDVLINNAGQGMYVPVENINIDDYKKILELNDIGPLIAMQTVIPHMRAQGGGSIVNISSMVSKNYYPNLGAYASTKYALNALSLTARAELEKDNIVVSIMLPGLTATDFGKNAMKTDATRPSMPSSSTGTMPTADTPDYIAERIMETITSGRAEVLAHE